MKTILFILPIILFISCGPSISSIQNDINGTITQQHIKINSTRLYLIPPKGFEQKPGYIGMRKGKTAIISIADEPGLNYYSIADTLTAEAYTNKGYKILDIKNLKVDSFSAKYFYMLSNKGSRTHKLIFGDSDFYISIVAVCTTYDVLTNNDMLDAIRSIVYKKNEIIDHREADLFTISDKNSRFKFTKYINGKYFYYLNGIDNTLSASASLAIVSGIQNKYYQTVEQAAENYFKAIIGSGGPRIRIIDKAKGEINKNEALEEVISYWRDGQFDNRYILIAKKDSTLVTFIGITKDSTDENIKEFKKLAHSIVIK